LTVPSPLIHGCVSAPEPAETVAMRVLRKFGRSDAQKHVKINQIAN